jgi:hypothetical protein
MIKLILIVLLALPAYAKISCKDVLLDISQDSIDTLATFNIQKKQYEILLREYFEIYMGVRPFNAENQRRVKEFQRLMQRDDFTGNEIKSHLDSLFEEYRVKHNKKNYAVFNSATEVNIAVHPKKAPDVIQKPLIVIIDWDQKPLSKKLFEAADLILNSVDGEIPYEDSLQLTFANTKKANFSGGFAESCLATGVASFILTTENAPNRSIQIVLTKKNIYFEHSSSIKTLPSTIYGRTVLKIKII